MGYSVMVAQLILVQFVRVQILVPQPYFETSAELSRSPGSVLYWAYRRMVLSLPKGGKDKGHVVSLYIKMLR